MISFTRMKSRSFENWRLTQREVELTRLCYRLLLRFRINNNICAHNWPIISLWLWQSHFFVCINANGWKYAKEKEQRIPTKKALNMWTVNVAVCARCSCLTAIRYECGLLYLSINSSLTNATYRISSLMHILWKQESYRSQNPKQMTL